MTFWLVLAATLVAAALSLLFSTLTYSLRDFSRARLADVLGRMSRSDYYDRTVAHSGDLIVATAACRLFSNILVLIGCLRLMAYTDLRLWLQYAAAVVLAGALGLVLSVAVPHALSRHAGETAIAAGVRFLHGLRLVLMPMTRLMNAVDGWVGAIVARAAPKNAAETEDQIEQEILQVVQEGQAEGAIDESERQMLESVIHFHDTQVGQIMTARPEIFALELGSTLETVKARIAESGHSRIPVYAGTLDHVVGILYARDLLKLLGEPPEQFNIRVAMRPAVFVPETKLLKDLLKDFRLQKIHIAVVSDEYGGTAGLVTIEDLFEELVGDVSDEHEPAEPAMLTKTGDTTAEADARIYIDELNRLMGLTLPEDAGFDTLGGYVSNTMGRIPPRGATFESDGVRFTVLDAEPQKVNRVRLELLTEPAETQAEPTGL